MRKSVIIQLLVFFVLTSFLYVDYVSGESKWNSITWDKTFGGRLEDKGFSITQTKDGGYALTGFIWTIYASKQDIWVIKLDAIGNLEWEKTFDGDENDVAYSLIQSRDGGYVVAGSTGLRLWGEANCWVIKLDAKGNMEWDNNFGGTGWDEIYSITQITDGSFVVTGCVWSKGAGRGDVY